MTTSFPSGLDSFTNPTATDAMDSATVPHADQHADVNDAVEALQAKVGVDGSAVTSSLDYQLNAIGEATSFTPSWGVTSGTLNLGAFNVGVYWKINEMTFMQVSTVFNASPGSGSLYLDLPSGLSINTMGTTFPRIGSASWSDLSASQSYFLAPYREGSVSAGTRMQFLINAGWVFSANSFGTNDELFISAWWYQS